MATAPSNANRFAGYTPDKPAEELSSFSTVHHNFKPQPNYDLDAAAVPLNLLADVPSKTNIESETFRSTLDNRLLCILDAIGHAMTTCCRVDPTITHSDISSNCIQLMRKKPEGVLYFEGDRKAIVVDLLKELSLLSGRTLACVDVAIDPEEQQAEEASIQYYRSHGYDYHNDANEEDRSSGDEEEGNDITAAAAAAAAAAERMKKKLRPRKNANSAEKGFHSIVFSIALYPLLTTVAQLSVFT